jgi:hypothetical protein
MLTVPTIPRIYPTIYHIFLGVPISKIAQLDVDDLFRRETLEST